MIFPESLCIEQLAKCLLLFYTIIYHASSDVWQVSVCSREVFQMVREVEGLEEPSAQWKRRGHVSRELKRLQQRVRNTLGGWLDYYRVAIGTYL